jgi:putative membrane protein insertion efficiency factor
MSSPSLRSVATAPAIWLVRAYQLVWSPMRPQTCRFYPSCSAYALTALERFGLLRGSWLAARRLLRCHPWNPGGVDHVPQRRPEHTSGHPTHQT